MFRRQFIQLLSFGTALGVVPGRAVSSAERTVTYRVRGFSCVTCATGLDTILRQHPGILSSRSTYPAGTATIVFDPENISQKTIVALITELGFAVEGEV